MCNIMVAVESDPSTLVLEAFFHPTWLYTDLLAQGHGYSWEVCVCVCVCVHVHVRVCVLVYVLAEPADL